MTAVKPKRLPISKLTIEHDSDDWWAYTPDGWCNSGEPSHTFHETTKRELMQAIRDYLAPCDCCPECIAVHKGA